MNRNPERTLPQKLLFSPNGIRTFFRKTHFDFPLRSYRSRHPSHHLTKIKRRRRGGRALVAIQIPPPAPGCYSNRQARGLRFVCTLTPSPIAAPNSSATLESFTRTTCPVGSFATTRCGQVRRRPVRDYASKAVACCLRGGCSTSIVSATSNLSTRSREFF